MVSSVFVLFTGDAGEAPSRTTECGEEGKTICGREVALGVGEEGMFRMEIKARHASRDWVSTVISSEDYVEWTGESVTPPILIKNAI